MIMDTNKKKVVKYPLIFFVATIFRSSCEDIKNTQQPCPHRWTSSSELTGQFVVKWSSESTYHSFLGNGDLPAAPVIAHL